MVIGKWCRQAQRTRQCDCAPSFKEFVEVPTVVAAAALIHAFNKIAVAAIKYAVDADYRPGRVSVSFEDKAMPEQLGQRVSLVIEAPPGERRHFLNEIS